MTGRRAQPCRGRGVGFPSTRVADIGFLALVVEIPSPAGTQIEKPSGGSHAAYQGGGGRSRSRSRPYQTGQLPQHPPSISRALQRYSNLRSHCCFVADPGSRTNTSLGPCLWNVQVWSLDLCAWLQVWLLGNLCARDSHHQPGLANRVEMRGYCRFPQTCSGLPVSPQKSRHCIRCPAGNGASRLGPWSLVAPQQFALYLAASNHLLGNTSTADAASHTAANGTAH